MLPKLAAIYIPILMGQIAALWPAMPAPSTLAAQVEQETCVSLTSPRCWNPHTELKTSREYGFGLGQLTVTPRFNNFKAARTWDKSLRNWQWSDRFDAKMQLAALVAYDRNLFHSIRFGKTSVDRLAFTFSAYNGGLGGVLKDRAVCEHTAGCDPSVWFGNVERTSFRAKVAVAGYGHSFFDINRTYVRNVLIVRRDKYRFMDGKRQ
ncbi:MAG: lytic murein transglycosylase [Alphaproteobacteria bacterium]|nr:lytic murein transglycosylase [Alphaproteobacteria bacterium]